MIAHKALLHKLRKRYNFHPSATQLLGSYFRNRQQSTHTQHAQSTLKLITDGIPQGSTLSTILFIFYYDDDIYQHTSHPTEAFADDSKIVIAASTLPDLLELAQSDIKTYVTQLHANGMAVNLSKSSFTIFYPKRLKSKPCLHFAGQRLTHKTEAKTLGLMLRQDLKHVSTINKVLRKLHAAKAPKLLLANY